MKTIHKHLLSIYLSALALITGIVAEWVGALLLAGLAIYIFSVECMLNPNNPNKK